MVGSPYSGIREHCATSRGEGGVSVIVPTILSGGGQKGGYAPSCDPFNRAVSYPRPHNSIPRSIGSGLEPGPSACGTVGAGKERPPVPLSRLLAFTRLGFLAALVTAPATLHAQAQATTGVIRGVVSDSAGGGPLAGAQVSLVNTETNAERVLTTNDRGVFVATLLRVGTYNVSARALGFQASQRNGIAVRLGETVDLPFALAPQAVQLQELTARAQEPAVDVTKSEGATRLGAEVVEGLPNNGRNIFNYTTLTPNVAIVQGPDGDEISVGGQKGIHNNVSVDGADFNNPFFGEQRGGQRPAFTFNLDAVQDFVVVADGANAEFGRSSGGFINVITKSGTNQFHGSAHYFGKYDGLSADFSHTFTERDHHRLRSGLQAASVRRHARRAAGSRQGVLLPGLRSAGIQRPQADRRV